LRAPDNSFQEVTGSIPVIPTNFKNKMTKKQIEETVKGLTVDRLIYTKRDVFIYFTNGTCLNVFELMGYVELEFRQVVIATHIA
jgi:hypothetical protein